MRVLVPLYRVKQVKLQSIQHRFGSHAGHKEEAGFGIMGMQLLIREDIGSVDCVKRIQRDMPMGQPNTLLIIEAVECMKSWASDGPAGLLPFNDVEQVRVMLEELEDKGTNV